MYPLLPTLCTGPDDRRPRLTSAQERSKYRNRIFVGFGMIGATFAIVIIVIFVSCTPITKWWQMNPDPGRK